MFRKSRFLATVTAAAVALSAISAPPAGAATVAPPEGDSCTVTLTDAELAWTEYSIAAVELAPYGAEIAGYSAVLPGFQDLLDDMAEDPDFDAAVALVLYELETHGTETQPSEEDLAVIEAGEAAFMSLAEKYAERRAAMGIPYPDIVVRLAVFYADPDAMRNALVTAINMPATFTVPDSFTGGATPTPLVLTPEQAIAHFQGVTEDNAQAFTDAFNQAYKEPFDAFAPREEAMNAASEVCAAGGGEVEFPTSYNPVPDEDQPVDPADQGSSSSVSGSSQAGIVVAILALIATLGGAVALAPQLGIQLPKLPF